MKNLFLVPILFVLFLVCTSYTDQIQNSGDSVYKTINDIKPPIGYVVDSFNEKSFSSFIQNLPLKTDKEIHSYDGKVVDNAVHKTLVVVDMPLLFKSNLEQCADFAMRFWAEYYKKTNKLDSLYLFTYNGKRRPYNSKSMGYKEFLRDVFSTTNSHSLKVGCKQINKDILIPGDLIVQNTDGAIGHVSVILNSCKSIKDGSRLYLIGYSFMPAQEFHVEDALNLGKGGWFTLEGYFKYLKNYLDLGDPVLRRF